MTLGGRGSIAIRVLRTGILRVGHLHMLTGATPADGSAMPGGITSAFALARSLGVDARLTACGDQELYAGLCVGTFDLGLADRPDPRVACITVDTEHPSSAVGCEVPFTVWCTNHDVSSGSRCCAVSFGTAR